MLDLNLSSLYSDSKCNPIFTVRNSSCRKVMFSQASVSHPVHGGGGGVVGRLGGYAWQEGMRGRGHGGVDMHGRVCAEGMHATVACVVGVGVGGSARMVGETHPTGMHWKTYYVVKVLV